MSRETKTVDEAKKEKEEKMEKVSLNKELVRKRDQMHLDRINKRTIKKEKYALNFNNTNKFYQNQKKEKDDERRKRVDDNSKFK